FAGEDVPLRPLVLASVDEPSRRVVSYLALLRRHAEDDVEPGREFADRRSLDWSEIDGERLAGLRTLEALVDAVLAVSRMALDVHLGGQQFFLTLADLEVDM